MTPEQTVHAFQEKTGVFKITQDPEVQGDGQHEREPAFPPPGLSRKSSDQKPGQIVHEDDRQHQQHVNRFPPGVEQKAEQKQLRVAPRPGTQLRHKNDCRQEEKQKDQI